MRSEELRPPLREDVALHLRGPADTIRRGVEGAGGLLDAATDEPDAELPVDEHRRQAFDADPRRIFSVPEHRRATEDLGMYG